MPSSATGNVIHVNGEPTTIPPGSTLTQLLTNLGLQDRRVAVAVNRSVIPRSGRTAVSLSGGDHVEILEAVGGG